MIQEAERSVCRMYSAHPSPGYRDKLAAADRRMELRLHCCGIETADYAGRDVLDTGYEPGREEA